MFGFEMSLVSVVISAVVLVVGSLVVSIMFRRVVSTNMVHIVQRKRKTTPHGTGQDAGNVYFAWPFWLPFIGVTVKQLPVSNFALPLSGYEAYDKDRVPFRIDVVAFFRVDDTALAAQRLASVEALEAQLKQIVQGAVRSVLASDVIDNIMLERAKYGEMFTTAVRPQVEEWGVKAVKSIEFMDIRDTEDSKVVHNIMAKKTSHIAMLSRTEVANNNQLAKVAEIKATQAEQVQQQEADEAVGKRTAEKEQQVGIANQQAQQQVLEQEKDTRIKHMEVVRVEQVRQAEITKEQQIIFAEQGKQTKILDAEGILEQKRREAEGIRAIGDANAAAKTAMELAPVTAQVTLAKEIGQNEGYQKYLVTIEAVKAYMAVGGEQAKALQHADVKVISNAGKPTEGIRNAMDLFSSNGGTELGSMIEALAQTPLGAAVLASLGVGRNGGHDASPSAHVEND